MTDGGENIEAIDVAAMRARADGVDGIPVRWVAPDAPAGVALWLTHLGGSAEESVPMRCCRRWASGRDQSRLTRCST
jgi:hypothetical protein